MANTNTPTVRTFGQDCLGNITGYVVGVAGEKPIGVFCGDIYERGSFERAKQQAEECYRAAIAKIDSGEPAA